MNYDELLKLFADVVPQSNIISIMKDDNFEVNQSQMSRFESVVKYLKVLSDKQIGALASIVLKPSERHGTVIASFGFLDLPDKLDVSRFCVELSQCSSVDISGSKDGSFELSCTVKDVFVQKPTE